MGRCLADLYHDNKAMSDPAAEVEWFGINPPPVAWYDKEDA
jgi:hypothetical protein